MSNFEIEIKSYNNLIKQTDLSLNKFSQFFKTICENGLKFADRSQKSLNEFSLELKKERETASYVICLTNFCNYFKKFFDKIHEIFKNIETQCIEKINEFSNNFKNNIYECINNISKLDMKLKEKAFNFEKIKKDYFYESKLVADQELKIQQLQSKNKKDNEFLEKHNKSLEQAKAKYLNAINEYNKYAADINSEYLKSLDKICIQQKKKIEFIYETLNTFKKELINFGESNTEIINLIEKLNKSMNINRDVDLFKDEYNFCNEEKKRILPETFLDYDIIKNNSEELKLQKKSSNKKEKKNNSSKMLGFTKKNDEIQKIINEIVPKLIINDNKLNDEETNILLNYLQTNNYNHEIFINILMENYHNKEFITLNNLYNFNILSSNIKLVTDSNSNDIINFHEIYFFIIKFAENVFFINNDNNSEYADSRNYLCKKVSEITLFSKKEFWIDLINIKIKIIGEEKTKKEIEKKEKNKNLKRNSADKSNNTYYSKLKGYLSHSNNVENKIVFGKMYNDNLPLYCIEVLEEYIKHFSNFNLCKKKSIEIVKEMHEKYKFEEIYLEYFLTEINSNAFSKNSNINIFYDLNKENINDQYKFVILNNENTNDTKLKLLIYSIYNLDLDLNDYFNIIKVSKKYYKILKKVIYKKILLKYPNIKIEKKIKIWKIILDYDDNKEKYNYKEIKKKIIEKYSNQKERDLIQLDVIRTNFIKDKELNQKKINYILKAIVETFPGINYNQGMNFIAAFLINIFDFIKEENNEEESFYIFLGLLTSTNYSELFKNNLELLKKFFYIIERLISILLPELYNYFQDNNIRPSYFISPWFLTLFSKAYEFTNLKLEPKVLLKIWDLFFLEGWKSIFSTIIFILKNNESRIMIYNDEELLNFLNKDIIKEKFFENENFNKFIHNFKIDDELIENIEKEFDFKNRNLNIKKI